MKIIMLTDEQWAAIERIANIEKQWTEAAKEYQNEDGEVTDYQRYDSMKADFGEDALQAIEGLDAWLLDKAITPRSTGFVFGAEFVVPLDAWEPDSDPELSGRLSSTALLTVAAPGGNSAIPLHLSAYEVKLDEQGCQAVADQWQDEFDAMYRIYDPCEPFCTVTINGKEYVVNAVPFGD